MPEAGGGAITGPAEGRRIRFGRNRHELDICIGTDDRKISRCHGVPIRHRNLWWVGNTGRQPIRLAGSRKLFTDEEPSPLGPGYTPLLILGSGKREHLLELYVAGADERRKPAGPADPTHPPRVWRLSEVGWNAKRVEHLIVRVRTRLSAAGPGPTREEVGEPVGNSLDHDLICELMDSTTLVPRSFVSWIFPTEQPTTSFSVPLV